MKTWSFEHRRTILLGLSLALLTAYLAQRAYLRFQDRQAEFAAERAEAMANDVYLAGLRDKATDSWLRVEYDEDDKFHYMFERGLECVGSYAKGLTDVQTEKLVNDPDAINRYKEWCFKTVTGVSWHVKEKDYNPLYAEEFAKVGPMIIDKIRSLSPASYWKSVGEEIKRSGSVSLPFNK